MKKTLILALISCNMAWAQSKKEMRQEIEKLQAQVTELSKPKPIKEIDTTQEENKNAYALGLLVSDNVKTQLGGEPIAVDALLRAIGQTLRGEATLMNIEQAQKITQTYFQQLAEKKMGPIKKENADFLEANKTKPDVHTTGTGLQYKVIKKSNTGKKPIAANTVKVHYAGRLIDGKEFDSSIKRGEPISFPLNGVIAGWTEGLQLMDEGDKFEFYIPYHLAYGERGSGPVIPPFATLIFEVELLKIEK